MPSSFLQYFLLRKIILQVSERLFLPVLQCQQDKDIAFQKDVWEYEILVRDLHDRMQTEVMQRICRGQDDADTQMLEELFALLRVATSSHSPAVWEYPRFEEIKKKLEED